MKKAFAAVVMLSCAVAFAQADKKMAPATGNAQMKDAKGGNMGADSKMGGDMKGGDMAQGGMGWKPPKVTKEDKKGVEDFMKAMETSMGSGDMDKCASMLDFPVTMITDNSAGNGMSTTMDKDQWMKTMSESMKGMPKDMPKPTMKDTTTFLSDNLAVVVTDMSMKMGKDNMKWKSAHTLVKKDGKWMGKVLVEGGWGDMMKGTGGAGTMGTEMKK
ncbi:MAG: hypothetical protein ACJ790_18420 [Myxococcaceae bacterium]